jgi:hypothetical protein
MHYTRQFQRADPNICSRTTPHLNITLVNSFNLNLAKMYNIRKEVTSEILSQNCTYLAIYIKLGPTYVRHINIFGQGKIISFFLMVICNSLLLLKSLPIKIQKVLFKVGTFYNSTT